MKIPDYWIPSSAMVAVVLLVVSAIAIRTEEKTFARKSSNGRTVPLNLPNGLSRPGLAMELADSKSVEAVLSAGVDLTADPAIVKSQKEANLRAMAWMQYWDFPFIAGYVALFVIIARRASLLGFRPLNLIAFVAGFTAIAAGVLDILEDCVILAAMRTHDGALQIRPFGWSKWAMVFVTMLLESSVFFAWTNLPTSGRILSLLAGVGFFSVSLLGVQSTLLQCDASLELDSGWLTGVLTVLALFTAWRFVRNLLPSGEPAPAASEA